MKEFLEKNADVLKVCGCVIACTVWLTQDIKRLDDRQNDLNTRLAQVEGELKRISFSPVEKASPDGLLWRIEVGKEGREGFQTIPDKRPE